MSSNNFDNICIPDTNLSDFQKSAKSNDVKEPIGFLVHNQIKKFSRTSKKLVQIYDYLN